MVMEPTQQVDGSQNKIDYPQDISMEFQQHNAHSENLKGPLKSDNVDPKKFQPNSNGPESDQFKSVPPSRPFVPAYGDTGIQRPTPMYGEGMLPPSVEQSLYQQTGGMPTNSTSLTANTPTLNQLLTQNPAAQPKYPPGYGDYTSANSGSPSIYDGWNSVSQHQPTSMASNPVRPGMPLPNRPMAAANSQMASNNAYDRGGVHQGYRHPNPSFGPPGAGYPRMMGAPQGYPPMDASQGASSEGSETDSNLAQQRMRPMMATHRMMGPPRTPGLHLGEQGGQMLPPPNQGQAYPGMYPYSGQPYRNVQMSPYTNYASNQIGQPLNRTAQPGLSQVPGTSQHQVNGPHKLIPHSPGASLSQPQPAHAAAPLRGAPAASQQTNVPPSPAGSTGQPKALSPCPSPSVRSMPPSPATSAQLNSPRPGLSPHPESVASPRTDPTGGKQESVSTSMAPSSSTSHASSVNQSDSSQSHIKADPQLAAAHVSQQHMLPPQQMRMMPTGTNNASAPSMGNGMPAYGHRMPGPGQPSGQFMPGTGPSQYPPSHSHQMAYGNTAPVPGPWQQAPMPGDLPRMPNTGPMYPLKNDKGPVSSPLSSTQSPSAAASPHSAESNRRPSSRKSSDAGSHKSQKAPGPNTVHGTSMDIVNKQVDMGPPEEAPQRRQFFEHLCAFYLETSKPLSSNPSIGKNPLDLYKVFTLVKEKGGFVQVCKKKLWKPVGSAVAVSTAANAAYTLKKAYMKFLLNYECKFEMGGADPQSIINSVETKKERTRNAPSPAGSGNSQDAHLRAYPEYPVGPGGPSSQVHPAHMAGGPMRPGQYHHDPNQPPHQQHGYMNYNNMPGAPPPGLPNGHHPMPPHQPSSLGSEEQGPSQTDPGSDPYHQQMPGGQYSSQHQMSAPGYQPRHPYYGPRMPPPGAQRPQFHQPQSSGPQQPAGPTGSQMRMPQPHQSGYPPVYREPSNYPNNQSGLGPPSSTNTGGFPSMGSQPNMAGGAGPSAFPSSSIAGANQSQISATANHNMTHASPATPMARYSHRGFQTQTRGALSAMLSNSNSTPEARGVHGQHWRQRPPMPPPGYSGSPAMESMSRRQLSMPRQPAAPKKEVVFPPGSVEATQINKMPRRLLHSKHIGKVDTARLIMCLRSGLLCESVWALDSITIYLQDESTSLAFSLGKVPALFDAVIAHYKQSLAQLFAELADLTGNSNVEATSPSEKAQETEVPEPPSVVLDGTNYSWFARNGLKVITDSEPKNEQLIPTPSMYSQKPYTSQRVNHCYVATHESGDDRRLYTKHFACSIARDKNHNSPTINHPNEEEHRTNIASSSLGVKEEYSACNGCASLDPKAKLPDEADQTDRVALQSRIDKKMNESAEDLKTLEEKLSHSRKRRFSETIDIEPIVRDEPPLESQVDMRLEELSTHCLALANILRGFSFIPSNEKVMAETTSLLYVLGRLLKVKTWVEEEETHRHWWWSTLEALREHSLVTLSNIAGYIQLIGVPHEICFPLLDSLLFWATTNAAYARDPLPGNHSLCIRNLVMEVMCKLCAHSDNMNLLLSTPPHDRITSLFQCLAKLLSEPDQVRREFALVTVSCLAQADAAAARGLALQTSCVSQLISILESAEAAALSIAQSRGVRALRDKPEAMGTSLDMIRRTSATLVEMAQVEANHSILLSQQDRLLNLVMSQILDQHVAKMLSDVLYECTKDMQVDIAPSYIISAEMSDGEESIESEHEGSITEELSESMDTGCKGRLKVREGRQLGKENINKSSLDANSSRGIISAVS